MTTRLQVVLWALAFIACEPAGVTALPPADVRVSEAQLVFPATYVGARSTRTVTFSNAGGLPADVELVVDAPFSVDEANFTLSRGAAVTVEVTFAPTTPGLAQRTLRTLPLEGEGLAIPECQADTACTTARFDVAAAQCLEANRPDGTSCETSCLTGQCSSGACVGSVKGCETNDLCLIPTCDEVTGCGAAPRVCPVSSSPCQVPSCDSAAGCGFTDALDGTLCGDDDCFATQVDVCITGQCVSRPRPVTAQCSNRWVPDTFPTRDRPTAAYDVLHSRLVVFGGLGFDDTWTHDGARWEQRLPVGAPTMRSQHGMTWDPVRKRVLLFGGALLNTRFDETWEWDGSTWLRRTPVTSPPPRAARKNLEWDRVRRRAVLFLGADGTWEWDGSSWSRRATGGPPVDRTAIAWDGLAQRVVLFGGHTSSGQRFNTTWEWDGAQWTARPVPMIAPSPRFAAALTWDSLRRRLVLVGGFGESMLNDTWEWDGLAWLRRTPATPQPESADGTLLFDEARGRAVLLNGDDSGWEWDGTDWRHVARVRPPLWVDSALSADTLRRRVVLFGGRDLSAQVEEVDETWEWDGASWSRRQPVTSPSPRSAHAMSYDPVNQRTVLFGGAQEQTSLSDTWLWDGTDWQQPPTTTAPASRGLHVMAWDAARQRTVLFGADNRNDTWTWDGATWLAQTPVSSPPPTRSVAAWDDVQQRVLVQSVSTWSWNGVDWAEHVPSPPWRFTFAMAADVARRRVIFVVRAQQFTDPMETWEWNGVSWTMLQPVARLPSGSVLLMTWDPVRLRVMAMLDGTVWHFLP